MAIWQPQHTIDDLQIISDILFPYLEKLSPDQWHMKTGTRDQDWTLHQVLAHLVSIAELFELATFHAFTGDALDIPNLTKREDLRAFNQSEIERLTQHTPASLIGMLRENFEQINSDIAIIEAQDYEKTVDLKIYGRPMRLRDVIDAQLSHIGVVHSYQIRPIPSLGAIWRQYPIYPMDMMSRMIDRFLRHISYTYWYDRANGLVGDIHFDFRMKGLDSWTMHITSDGAWLKHGLTDTKPLVKFTFRDSGVFYKLFTQEMTFHEAIRQAWLQIEGNYPEPLTLLSYFSPSPPKRSLPQL